MGGSRHRKALFSASAPEQRLKRVPFCCNQPPPPLLWALHHWWWQEAWPLLSCALMGAPKAKKTKWQKNTFLNLCSKAQAEKSAFLPPLQIPCFGCTGGPPNYSHCMDPLTSDALMGAFTSKGIQGAACAERHSSRPLFQTRG